MFLISKFRSVAQLLPKPLYMVTQAAWRLMRKAITYAYFGVRYPNTKIVFKSEKTVSGQFGQPQLVDDLLGGRHEGVFLDIGANHPEFNNNTAFFEHHRNYSGWAFDPLNKYQEMWHATRPRTTFIKCALGAEAGQLIFHEATGGEGWEDQLSYVTEIDPHSISGVASSSHSGSIIEVKPLRDFDIGEVDFASIDVEGYEEMVLKGMFPEIRPKVILVENCGFPVGSEEIRRLVISHGYEFHSRIRYIDDLYVRKDF